MSAVLPGGSPARAGDEPGQDGAEPERERPTTDDVAPRIAVPAHGNDGEPSAVPVPVTSGSTRAEPAHAGRMAGWPSWLRVPLQVAGRTAAKAWQDRILGLSAEASFWQILSVPPLLIGLLGTLGYVGQVIGAASVQEIENKLLSASAEVLTPDVVDSLVKPTLNDILNSGRLDIVSVGFLLSLWAGSSATATFINTAVIAYDQRDVRGPIATRLIALWLFVVGLVVAVLTLPLLVLGREVLVNLLPAGWRPIATVLINAVYWPLVVVGLVLVLTSFYHVMLPRRLPWLRHVPGALLAMGFFLVAATILRTYVADILTTALPYGALATPIAALLFCFFFAMGVLLGAELNATIQARWPAPLHRHERRRRARRAAKLASEARKPGPADDYGRSDS